MSLYKLQHVWTTEHSLSIYRMYITRDSHFVLYAFDMGIKNTLYPWMYIVLLDNLIIYMGCHTSKIGAQERAEMFVKHYKER